MGKASVSIGSFALAAAVSAFVCVIPCAAQEAPAITEVKTLLDSLPSGWKASYGAIDHRADSDTLTIKDLKLTAPGSIPLQIAIGMLETDRLDTKVLSSVIRREVINASALLAGEIRAEGVSAERAKDFSASVKQLTVTDVTMSSADTVEKALIAFKGGVYQPLADDAGTLYSDMGYDAPPLFDGGGSYGYGLKDGRIKLDDAWLEADKVGRFDLALDVIGHFPDYAAPDKSGKLSLLHLRYMDNSLVERIFTYLAKQDGKKPDAVRQESVAILAMTRLSLGTKSKKAADVLEKAIAFLREPESFDLSLRPKEPVSLDALGGEGLPDDPDKIIDMLGLKLKVNE